MSKDQSNSNNHPAAPPSQPADLELEEGEIEDDTDVNLPIPSLKELLELAQAAAAREERAVMYPIRPRPRPTNHKRRMLMRPNVNSKRVDSYRPGASIVREEISSRPSRQPSQGSVHSDPPVAVYGSVDQGSQGNSLYHIIGPADAADLRSTQQDGHGKLVYVPPPLAAPQPLLPQNPTRRLLNRPIPPSRRFAPYSTSAAARPLIPGSGPLLRNRTYSPAPLRSGRGRKRGGQRAALRQGSPRIGNKANENGIDSGLGNHVVVRKTRGRIYRNRGSAYLPFHANPNLRGRFRRPSDIRRTMPQHHEARDQLPPKSPVRTDSVGVQATLDFPMSPPQAGYMTPGVKISPAVTPSHHPQSPDYLTIWDWNYQPSPIHYADDDDEEDVEGSEIGYHHHDTNDHYNDGIEEQGDDTDPYFDGTDAEEEWLEVGAGTPWYQQESKDDELYALYHPNQGGEGDSAGDEQLQQQHQDHDDDDEVYSAVEGSFTYEDDDEAPYYFDYDGQEEEEEEFDPETGYATFSPFGISTKVTSFAIN